MGEKPPEGRVGEKPIDAELAELGNEPYELDVTYWSDADETKVSLNGLKLVEQKDGFLKLSFNYKVKGRSLSKPKTVKISFFSNLKDKGFGPKSGLSFVGPDGQKMNMSRVKYDLVDTVYHTYDVEVPLPVFMRFAAGNDVTGTVGGLEFKLDPVQLEGLKKFLGKIPAAQ